MVGIAGRSSLAISAWIFLTGICVVGNAHAIASLHEPAYYGGKVYYVDTNHPQAADENPGTRDLPWKTLEHAGVVAQAGDHVYIRAGIYRETLTVKNSGALGGESPRRELDNRGKRPERIVFEAYRDERVILDGSEIIPEDLWQPVDGRARVYEADLSRMPEGWRMYPHDLVHDGPEGFVFFNDALLEKHRTRNIETGEWRTTVPGPEDAMTRYYDREAGKLYVNLGGADPRRDGRVEITVRRTAINTAFREWITVRKLNIRRFFGTGLEATRTVGIIIEDCNFHHVATSLRIGGLIPIIRRNRVHHTINRGVCLGGYGLLVHDNIVSDFALARRGYQTHAFTVFSAHNARFLHNIAYQSPSIGHGGGFWPDVPNVSHIWRGNAGIHAGYYIEAPPINNQLQWNVALYSDIHLRHNYGGTVIENLVAWSPRAGFIIGTGGEHNSFLRNWLKENRVGISVTSEQGKPGVQMKNFAQGNIYEIPEGGYVANWAGRPYKTLEEFRAATGQETLGREEEIDLDQLGLVWVRLDEVEESYKPFPLFGNPYLSGERLSSRVIGRDLFFWWRGNAEFRGDVDRPDLYPEVRIRPRRGEEYAGSVIRDPLSIGPPAEHSGLDGHRPIAAVEGTPVKDQAYVVTSFKGSALDEKGYGMWSPSLPVVPGATIDLAVWMSLVDVQPVAEDGGAVVYVEWSDWTNQNKSRSYLVGGETGDAIVNPGFNRGTLDWSRISGSVIAPAEARRFSLYLGMRSASGQAMYGAVEKINTRAGIPPEEAVVAAEEITDAPLVAPERLEFSIVDLSPFVNRALEDEEADDGEGGWSDQGPGYDMRGLDTGLIEHEGVPYKILAPKSCIVLDARPRPQSNLPESVAIPVGEQADALYFLHSGAWIGGNRAWSYRLDYEDGTVFEIPVIGGVNIRDWSVAGLPYEFLNTDIRRATVWPQIVGNTLSPYCGLYILEHLNPHPDRTIKEIHFMQDEDRGSVPILLNITLGRKKAR